MPHNGVSFAFRYSMIWTTLYSTRTACTKQLFVYTPREFFYREHLKNSWQVQQQTEMSLRNTIQLPSSKGRAKHNYFFFFFQTIIHQKLLVFVPQAKQKDDEHLPFSKLSCLSCCLALSAATLRRPWIFLRRFSVDAMPLSADGVTAPAAVANAE